MAAEQHKANILSSLRGEISQIIREELKCALAEDFEALKSDLHAVRSEITNTTAIRSDKVTSLQATLTSLQSQVTSNRTLAPPQQSLE